jgi:flagellar biosynthesis component FlhA
MEGSGSKEVKMKGSGLKEAAKIEDIIKSDSVDRKTKIEVFRFEKAFESLMNQPPVKSQSKEEAKMEDSESAVGNSKTKMATKRLDKKSIDIFKNQPPPKPLISNSLYVNQLLDVVTYHDEVQRVFLEYLEYHSSIKGYAEVQEEVTDDEGDDHKLV